MLATFSELWFLRAAILFWCVALCFFVSILVDEYCVSEKSRREKDKPPSQPNESPGRNLGKL